MKAFQRRTAQMRPQERFCADVFHELISYLTLDEYGYITLHIKTQAKIMEERENQDGSTKDTQEGGYSH